MMRVRCVRSCFKKERNLEREKTKEEEKKRLAPEALIPYKFGPSGVGAPPSPNLNALEKPSLAILSHAGNLLRACGAFSFPFWKL